MNLFDMLDNYKTNPKNEVRKINTLLNQRVGYGSQTLWALLHKSFVYSEFSKIETDLDAFYKNIVLKNPAYDEMSESEISIMGYRIFCELILNLLATGESYGVIDPTEREINHTKDIIKKGLELCGYEVKLKKQRLVTKKVDIHAETVAAENKEYSDYIFDYLISKTAKDKEQCLLNLCNKLQAIKPVDNYTRHTRDYVQFLRHPDERKKIKKYSWFYEKENYSKNLEKLFRILLTYIAHLNSYLGLSDFDNHCMNNAP